MLLRPTVTGVVSHAAVVGLWLLKVGQYHIPVPSDPANAVGDEFFCSAGVFRIEVRPHHAAPHTAALVEGAGADRVQAGFLAYRWLHQTAPSYLAEKFHHHLLSSPISVFACPTHPLFNNRRSSFSGRCFSTVEHFAAECHPSVFVNRLKTYLFDRSFPKPV